MTCVFVSVGSNVERESNVGLAIRRLRECYGELVVSSVYETAAVGFDGDPFYNLVVRFTTDQSPSQLQSELRRIETEAGRERSTERFASRTLDLDLLLFDDLVSDEEGLQVPRDEIVSSAHVLKPLAEIAGTCTHPVLGTTYDALWRALSAESAEIRKIELGGL